MKYLSETTAVNLVRPRRVVFIAILLQMLLFDGVSGQIIHSAWPGVGDFPEDPGIHLTVAETRDGYLVEMVFEQDGSAPLFVGGWKSDGWTRFFADEVTKEGVIRPPVAVLFNSFSEGPYGVGTGTAFRLPPTEGEYVVTAESTGINCIGCAPARVVFEYSVEEMDPPLLGDFNFDDRVTFEDFLILSSNFGHLNRSWKDGDATLDELVDFQDFLILSHNFGATREPQFVAVPEPTSLGVLGLGLCLVGMFRQRRGRELEQPFSALTIVCTLLLAVSGTCHAQALDLTHRPGVGFFGTGIEGDSFLEVTATSNGAIVTLFLETGGPAPPRYSALWKANEWTRFTVDEVTMTGDRVVDESFNPFGDIGGFILSTGNEFVLPATNHREYYAVGLHAHQSNFFCRDENGEFANVCTGEYTMRYTVTAFPTPLGGDFNYDDTVDIADFTILSSNFSLHKPGFSWKDGDATLDGVVDFADFLILSHNFGVTREPQFVAVPEPASPSLLAVVLYALGTARRRRSKTLGRPRFTLGKQLARSSTSVNALR